MPQFFIFYILLVITELTSTIGTLTEGKPIVSEILPSSNYDREHILRIAASIKNGIIHPIALTIMKNR